MTIIMFRWIVSSLVALWTGALIYLGVAKPSRRCQLATVLYDGLFGVGLGHVDKLDSQIG